MQIFMFAWNQVEHQDESKKNKLLMPNHNDALLAAVQYFFLIQLGTWMLQTHSHQDYPKSRRQIFNFLSSVVNTQLHYPMAYEDHH